MIFIPTVTSNWKQLNLEGVEEVLLTPKDLELPTEPTNIIIDNGCFLINQNRIRAHVLFDHMDLCRNLTDPRCIFVLPDLEGEEINANFFLNMFMKIVKPKRFILVDLPCFMDEFRHLLDDAEFLGIPSRRAHEASQDITRYHLFGKDPPVINARSWDDLQYDEKRPLADIVRERSI